MSVMIAAFAPVITKKVQTSSVALSQQDQIAGKVIKSMLFNYSTSLNGVDGCQLVDSNTSLRCPFDVPEEVTELNFILVSGGGGGAGGTNSTVNSANAQVQGTQSTYITIDSFTRNVKIPVMVSGGGGGGGAYYYYYHKDATTIRPQSQTDCDKNATGSKYQNGVCVSPYLSPSSLTATHSITSLKSNTTYNDYQGSKVCWTSGNTGYSVWYDSCPSGECGSNYMYYKTAKPFPVCSYDAAKEICSKYAQGTSAFGKWRLPKSNKETNYVGLAYDDIGNTGKNGDNNAPMSQKCNYGKVADYRANSVGYSTWQDTGQKCVDGYYDYNDTTYSDKEDYYFNACLPDLFWYEDVNSTTITDNYYSYMTFKKCANSGYVQNYDRTSYMYIYERKMNALSVKCVLDDIGTDPAITKYNHATGGGGASGQYLVNITIPQDVISANINNRIWIGSGGGGSGGNGASSSGGTASNGSAGGTSYVYIKTTSGTLKWGIELYGGNGGKAASSSSTADGGAASGKYRYTSNGSTWTEYTSAVSGVVGSYTSKGNAGFKGTYYTSSGTLYGANGGAAPYGSYGAGGQGGHAYDQSAGKGADGTSGYVQLTYDKVYLGAPGGGGAGGQIARFEKVPVKENTRYWIKVGGGGAAGSDANGGNGGISAFCSNNTCSGGTVYITYGGNGGAKGTNQTASAKPQKGNGGSLGTAGTSSGTGFVFYKAGTAGGAADVNSSTLKGTGGVGGNGGLNNYLISIGKGYGELSIGCGGYYTNSTYLCNNGANKNAAYTADEYANPGKVHRAGSTKYGSAGSGGGGGGIDPVGSAPGAASKGQDGYVYIWWEDYAD